MTKKLCADMASASAGPFSLFCGGLAPSGDTSICDMYDARDGSWSVGHLAAPVREISGASISSGGLEMAVFLGGGHTNVFNAKTASWTYGNATAGRSPWAKMGSATVGCRYAVFGGGNGNCNAIEIFDAAANSEGVVVATIVLLSRCIRAVAAPADLKSLMFRVDVRRAQPEPRAGAGDGRGDG